MSAKGIMMTTENHSGFNIAERLSVVSAQCAFGQKVFNDIFASVHDTVDRRSGKVEQTFQAGVDAVLEELKTQAVALHADAVIAITISYTPIGYGSPNQTLVSGTGTAVRLQP